MDKIYYMAYGSNMCTKQIAKRCNDAKLVGSLLLLDYELEMKKYKSNNSYATISKKEGSSVPVVIFEISNEDEKNLDIYEGIDRGLYFKEIVEVELNNKTIQTMVYIMNLDAIKGIPSDEYIQIIKDGYIEHGFDFAEILQLTEKGMLL